MVGKTKNKRGGKFKRARVKQNCPFCRGEWQLHWTQSEKLQQFLSVRGRILAKVYTGVCAKHQRRLTETIKQARHLAQLPFVTGRES